MRLDARLAGQWTPAELGVRPVAGGGPLLACVRGPRDERLRVILAWPVAGSRLVVVRGEPGTGTSRAAGEAVAGVLAGWPLEYPRIAAVLDTASQLYQAALCRLCLVERRGYPCCSRRCCRMHGRPSRGSAGTAGRPMAAWCSGVRRLTDA